MNLTMQKPRRSPAASFIARYAGTCARCFGEIQPGDRVRYLVNELIHHRHEVVERSTDVCGTCWLVKPCDCD